MALLRSLPAWQSCGTDSIIGSRYPLVKLLTTFQQQIGRLSHEGHSLNMLCRVAEALHARVRIIFEPVENQSNLIREKPRPYGVARG